MNNNVSSQYDDVVARHDGQRLSARFSVVIPLYNGAATIGATLESILAQIHPPHEIIVVDDASADEGKAIVSSYADRVKLLRIDSNGGVQAARNRGIAHATGNWIALCDQDDLWAPDYLEHLTALLTAAPHLEFIFTNFRRTIGGVSESFTKFDQAPADYWQQAGRRELPEGWVFDRSIAGQTFTWWPIFPSAMVIARSLVEAVGGFDTAMRGLRPEDMEFTLRCLYRAAVGAIPEPLVTIRRHDTNYSRDQVLCLVDEVAALQFVRANHVEARPFWPAIDNEIRRRRINAAHGAFSRGDHQLFQRLLADIAVPDRTSKLRAKAFVASMPAPLNGWVNAVLQRLREILIGIRGGNSASWE